jgi:hypothetical protein
MSEHPETFVSPSNSHNKMMSWIVGGALALTASGIAFGPGITRSYYDAQSIEHKRGPAKDYVASTLSELVLSGQKINFTVGNHACDKNVNYGPDPSSRHCQVYGEATYAIEAKDSSAAYDVASKPLHHHRIETGQQTITYQGQNIEVEVDFSVRDATAYNGSLQQKFDGPKIPINEYAVHYTVAAYTVNRTVLDNPGNIDTP